MDIIECAYNELIEELGNKRRQLDYYSDNIPMLPSSEDKKIYEMSVSEKQTVEILKVLYYGAEILILDEPTAGLDPEERIRLRNYIAEISESRMVLVATHVVDDIECIAHKVILMKKGKLLRFATPGELIGEISGKVGEFCGTFEEVNSLKEKYGKGQTIRREEGFIFRVAEENLPENFRRVSDISLEDVYLFYAEGRK